MRGSRWTREEAATLQELGGTRLAEVAARTGRTLKAVKRRWDQVRPHVPAPAAFAKPPAALAVDTELARQIPGAASRPALEPIDLAPPPAALPRATPIAPARSCQWPEGDPGTPGFRLCRATSLVPGRPYCAAHCARAYRAAGIHDQEAAA